MESRTKREQSVIYLSSWTRFSRTRKERRDQLRRVLLHDDLVLVLPPSPTVPKPPRRQLLQPVIIHPRSNPIRSRKRRKSIDLDDLRGVRLRRKRSARSFAFEIVSRTRRRGFFVVETDVLVRRGGGLRGSIWTWVRGREGGRGRGRRRRLGVKEKGREGEI